MDDLVIIILTLIIAVVGIVGQIQKKRQPQPATNTDGKPEKSSDNFWDVLEDFGIQAQKPEPQIPENEPEEIKKKPSEQQKYNFDAENEGNSSVIKKTDIKDSITQNLEEERKERISDTFSLRKAVIYSEILNRKYT